MLFFRNKEEPIVKPLAEKAVGVHYAGGGVHVVEGTVALPNPCYALSVAVEKRGSNPDKILLRFSATPTADVCAEVTYEAPFRATINDISMALELEPRARVSAETGDEFSVRLGEEHWVEDVKLVFTGVEEDSRCPVKVQCIRAGSVTIRLMAGNEELHLRMPGDNEVPNAAVMGSYIVTLVNVKPHPATGQEALEDKDYMVTLRVEIHDIKG